ncbi:hypothetical protein GOBAR_AA36172 [Gossypium barbadense]|uniref:Cystatin domain-containing protein n=2 Tax=Gossypium barbadense TaxID=3634 RepID=A0A2P5W0B4_GOSBA|nr:hypothetical protein GOBAR_AA36172 [Gossypium barbadense]
MGYYNLFINNVIHQIYNQQPKPTKNRKSRLKIQLNSCFLILSLSYLFLPLILSDARKDALIEGWTSIKNIKDPHMTEITEFAVDEHNTQLKGSLKLEEVVKGETQVISGINYKLVLQAKDGTADNSCEAVVWEKAWLKFRKLTSFTLVKG